MRSSTARALRVACLALAVLAARPVPPAAADPVTPARLLDAGADQTAWLMNLGNYRGWRYSSLSQIDRGTVGDLVVRYHRVLGGMVEGGGNWAAAAPHSPLAADGYLYIVDGWGSVTKLDVRNDAEVVWESDAGQRNLDAWLQASRGIALYGDWVLSGGADGKLRWLDAVTGEVARSIQIADPATGYTIAAPPLVAGDIVIVAGGGADRPTSGRIDAIDANTGESLWTIAAPPGNGAADFVQSGLYDPEAGLLYINAGDPAPLLDGEWPEGDGGFANSVLALEVATGALKWRFRYMPNGAHGFSEAGTHMLIPHEGTDGARVIHFGNNGYFYALDAVDGRLLAAVPHVPGVEWSEGINASGVPINPAAGPAVWADEAGCPNIRGTPAFASAYSPRTGLAYGGGADGCQLDVPVPDTASNPGWYGAYYTGAANAIGAMSAINPVTGKVVAQRIFDFPLHSGVLATAGGIVFATTAEGSLHALDDRTLETLWSEKFATLGPSPPITFKVDGEQFIALVVSGNAFTDELSYRPPEMSMSEALFVLLILGLPS